MTKKKTRAIDKVKDLLGTSSTTTSHEMLAKLVSDIDVNEHNNNYYIVDGQSYPASNQIEVFTQALDALFCRCKFDWAKQKSFNKMKGKYKFSENKAEVHISNDQQLEQLKKSKIWINNGLSGSKKIEILEELSAIYGRKILGAAGGDAQIQYHIVLEEKRKPQ